MDRPGRVRSWRSAVGPCAPALDALLWTKPIGRRTRSADVDSNVDKSTITLAGDTLYVMSNEAHLYALDIAEGTVRWHRPNVASMGVVDSSTAIPGRSGTTRSSRGSMSGDGDRLLRSVGGRDRFLREVAATRTAGGRYSPGVLDADPEAPLSVARHGVPAGALAAGGRAAARSASWRRGVAAPPASLRLSHRFTTPGRCTSLPRDRWSVVGGEVASDANELGDDVGVGVALSSVRVWVGVGRLWRMCGCRGGSGAR